MPIVEHRLFGPPGTGKTTTVSKYVYDIAQQHGPQAVLVASFTRAAAEELVLAMGKKRMPTRIEDLPDPFDDDEESEGAGRLPVDRRYVGTLHALCYRALGNPTVAETKVEDWNTHHGAYTLSTGGTLDVDDGNASRVDGEGNPLIAQGGDALYNRMQLLRARLVARELWPESVAAFAKAWEDWKYSNDLVDFTDMIYRAYRDCTVAPGNPLFGIFDEAQDFTPLELALVRSWASHMQYILLAGDDDQTLYRFTGATPDAFLDPPVPDAQKHILTQSHRVPRVVQQVAQRWIERVSRREPKAYLPRAEEGFLTKAPPTATWRNPKPLVDAMLAYVAEGKSVMLLGSCSYMLEPVKHYLRDAGIPFHNPYRRKRGDWNPLGPTRGISPTERVLAYLRPDPDTWGEDAGWWTCEEVYRWVSALRSKGVLRHGVKAHLDTLKGVYSRITIEALDALFTDTMDGWSPFEDMPDLVWYAAHLLPDKARTMAFPIKVAQRHGGATLRALPKLILGTIHSVKGGEADVVFLLPDLSPTGLKEWMQQGEPRDSIYRLFYVGMTRAMEGLVMCPPASNTAVNFARVLA